MEDLKVNGERVNMAKICMWQQHLSSTSNKLEDTVFEGGVMTSFAQVTSFDMKTKDDKPLRVSASGVLMPANLMGPCLRYRQDARPCRARMGFY